jgi:VWFA-related protein
MTRFLLCSAVIAVALTIHVSARQQVFRAESQTVNVYATVTDKDRLVTDLKQENFQVFDNGRPQAITVFDNSPRPIRLIVLIDVSGSMQGNLPVVREAAGELFKRLRPDDRVRIGTFGRTIEFSPTFTNNVEELTAAMPTEIPPNSPTPLWRAVDQAITELENVEDRPVVLILSDGKDSGVVPFSRDPIMTLPQVTERATARDVMIYGIGMHTRAESARVAAAGGGLADMLTADWPDPGLGTAAVETGGGYVEVRPRDLYSGELQNAFARVAEELHSQYLLGFTPSVRDGKRHKIEVKVNVKDLKPRARKNYVAPATPKPSTGEGAPRDDKS